MTIEFSDEGSAQPIIGSEFAEVSVTIDRTANAPRLRLEDLRTGRVRYLDALELESIIWLSSAQLTELCDPSASRWRGQS
jgi:hypothetical protein